MLLPLAMHMGNELLSGRVAAGTILLAALAVGAAASRLRRLLDPEKLPLMGVLGAFVFAAQMINFTLPGMPGTSGHLGGGVLLAILLGPAPALVVMTSILIVQCLLFFDGGLLALGCNILNMGVVPCLLGGWIYRKALGPAGRARPARQYLAAWAACLAGVTGGAALVPLEADLSGVLRIPLAAFLAVMVGVHLIIALVEGLITFAVLACLRRVRPAAVGLPAADAGAGRLSRKALVFSLAATALLVAGVASGFASTHPDGLEWSFLEFRYGRAESTTSNVHNDSALAAAADGLQQKWSLLRGYTVPGHETPQGAWPNVSGWRSLAGLLGTLATLGLVYALSRVIRRRPPDSARR